MNVPIYDYVADRFIFFTKLDIPIDRVPTSDQFVV